MSGQVLWASSGTPPKLFLRIFEAYVKRSSSVADDDVVSTSSGSLMSEFRLDDHSLSSVCPHRAIRLIKCAAPCIIFCLSYTCSCCRIAAHTHAGMHTHAWTHGRMRATCTHMLAEVWWTGIRVRFTGGKVEAIKQLSHLGLRLVLSVQLGHVIIELES